MSRRRGRYFVDKNITNQKTFSEFLVFPIKYSACMRLKFLEEEQNIEPEVKFDE